MLESHSNKVYKINKDPILFVNQDFSFDIIFYISLLRGHVESGNKGGGVRGRVSRGIRR